MQKKIIALAIAGLASSAAFAQSSVTVYGVADVGVAHLTSTNLKSQNAVESGLLGGSRIGLKGAEDLGNGLKAIFTLEYAIAIDDNTGVGTADQVGTFASTADAAGGVYTTQNTNASGTLARQQFVGLTGGFGTAVAGRLQTAGYDWACAYNPIAGSALDTVGRLGAATLLQCGSGGRANNALAYISPSFGGVTVALNHARVTEAAALQATLKDNVAYLGSVSYANGPIGAGLVYSRINKDGTVGNDDVREWGLGASYDLKVVKLFATYQNQKDQSKTAGSDKKYSFAAAAPVTAAGTVVASYARNKISSNTTADDSTYAWNLSYLHSLSKRTTLYAGYTRMNNQDNAALGLYAGASAVKDPAGTVVTSASPTYGPTAGGNASVLGLGINHKF